MGCTNATEKAAAVSAAATALAEEIKYLPAGHPLIQQIQDTMARAAKRLAELAGFFKPGSDPIGTSLSICDELNVMMNSIRGFATQVSYITSRPDPTRIYLDPYQSSPWATLLVLSVAGLGVYWLYKWSTKEEYYPRHLVPRYAGGRRRL